VHCRCKRELEDGDPEVTFAPALNPHSLRLAQARKARNLHASLQFPLPQHEGTQQGFQNREGTPAGGRSWSPGHDRCFDTPDVHNCTFAPAVNTATEEHLARAGIPGSFEERQQYYRARREVLHSSSSLVYFVFHHFLCSAASPVAIHRVWNTFAALPASLPFPRSCDQLTTGSHNKEHLAQ
jgi:hypothetical protein